MPRYTLYICDMSYRREGCVSMTETPEQMSAEGGPRVVCQTWNDYGRTNGWMDEMGKPELGKQSHR